MHLKRHQQMLHHKLVCSGTVSVPKSVQIISVFFHRSLNTAFHSQGILRREPDQIEKALENLIELIVTADLFQKYPSLEAFAAADVKEMEQDIHSIGFYHNKAKNIILCARDLLERFSGEVPESLEDLTSLAGVGRKTANVIRGNSKTICRL